MFRMLRSLPFALALAALSIFAASCGSSNSKFRLVHAIPDGQAVDVLIDGKTVESAVAFDSVTPSSGYLSVSSGTRHLQVFPTGTTTNAYFDGNPSFSGGTSYTFVVGGPTTNTFGTLLTDNNATPTSGDGELRVIHASPSGPTPVDVYVVSPGAPASGTPSISGIVYQNASTYLNIPAGSFDVLITPNGLTAVDIRESFAPSNGQIRTFVLVDVQGGGSMASSPLVLNDLN
jgi:hypothetical protein